MATRLCISCGKHQSRPPYGSAITTEVLCLGSACTNKSRRVIRPIVNIQFVIEEPSRHKYEGIASRMTKRTAA